MNLLHLEYFYTVAKEGGYLRASEKLRTGQPAISRMVAQLEDYFGFKLFEKIGRNVRLTNKGEEVFENCKKIFGEVKTLQDNIGKISGEIEIGLFFHIPDLSDKLVIERSITIPFKLVVKK